MSKRICVFGDSITRGHCDLDDGGGWVVRLEKYNSFIKDFCQGNELPFIDMYDLLSKEGLEDGLHPNARGHEKIFERVRDFLIKNKIV